jgi:sigma-B regulation protein RsbU (phosphoserine phosphatase)
VDDNTLPAHQLNQLQNAGNQANSSASENTTLSNLFHTLIRGARLAIRNCTPGEVVFREGGHDDTMYVIQSGQVAIVKGDYEDPVVLAHRGKGEILGEMALLDDQPHSASVVALDDVQLLCVPRTDFQKLLKNDPVLVMKIMSTLCTRLRMAEDIRTAISRLEQKLARELEVAGQVQAKLLPDTIPEVRGWDVAATLIPARQTSGDYYDFIPLPDDHLGVLIADVADKGAAAALVMAVSRTLIHSFALHHPTAPERVFQITNERMLSDTTSDLFVTAFYAVLAPDSGTVTCLNAGHNPIYWFKAGGAVEMIGRTGLPLGTFEELTWETRTLQFEPGDSLVLYTDGLIEARTADREQFGTGRLEEVVKAHAGHTAQEILDALLAAVQTFAGDEPQFDDITLVVVTRR